MDDKNFNSFKNLKAPQSWIDNALDIQNSQKPKPVVFLSFSKYIASAACFMLVCAISLTFYFMNSNVSVPVSDNNSTVSTESDKSDIPDNNNINTQEHIGIITDDADKNSVTAGTEALSQETKPDNKKPTAESPTQPQTIEPTEPATNNTSTEPTEGTTQPTQTKPIQKPTSPTVKPQPTIPPTSPTQPPYLSPPGEGDNSQLPGRPGYPEAPLYPETTYTTFSTKLSFNPNNTEKLIYCTVTDENLTTLCRDMIATTYYSGGYYYASYNFYNTYVAKSGYYTCHFFNEKGQYIASVTKYIEV